MIRYTKRRNWVPYEVNSYLRYKDRRQTRILYSAGFIVLILLLIVGYVGMTHIKFK